MFKNLFKSLQAVTTVTTVTGALQIQSLEPKFAIKNIWTDLTFWAESPWYDNLGTKSVPHRDASNRTSSRPRAFGPCNRPVRYAIIVVLHAIRTRFGLVNATSNSRIRSLQSVLNCGILLAWLGLCVSHNVGRLWYCSCLPLRQINP